MKYYKINSPSDHLSYLELETRIEPTPLMQVRRTDDGYIIAIEFILDKPEATSEDWLNAKSN